MYATQGVLSRILSQIAQIRTPKSCIFGRNFYTIISFTLRKFSIIFQLSTVVDYVSMYFYEEQGQNYI